MAVKYDGKDYKKITLDEMVNFIAKNAPDDKAWFKSMAFDKVKKMNDNAEEVIVDKYNHLKANRAFCLRYAPELVPVSKKPVKPTAKEILKDW